jgi:hypothetical protein
MGKFYQTDCLITPENRHLHSNNLAVINAITISINESSYNQGYSINYNSLTKKTEQADPQFDDFQNQTKFICQFVNFALEYEETYKDRDDYLILLLKATKENIIDNYGFYTKDEKLAIKEVFYDLNLFDFFDEISSAFFKAKLNSYLHLYP